MGIGIKKKYNNLTKREEINQFYIQGLKEIIDYFDHRRIVLVSHSFSAYISLKYMIQYHDKRV